MHLLDYANPFHRRGFYALPHAIVVLLIVLGLILAFGLGFFTGTKLTENYYRTHYAAPLKVPHIFTPVHVAPKMRARATDAGSIHFGYFTSQTDDQGSLGSCEGWAFAKVLSYAANWNAQPDGTHWHRFYSPRFFYDAVSNCQDNGSYLEQFPSVVQSQGAVRWRDMPYGHAAEFIANPLPDFAVECPTPQWANALAKLSSLGVSETQLFANQGSGPGGLALIHAQLATHHAVAVDLPVFPEYDRANSDGSTVTLPQPGEGERGGHANVDVKSDPTHNNGDGTFGADLFSNQWSEYAGVGPDGIRHAGANNGFVWVSWQFIEQYVWDAAVIHVPKSAPSPTPTPTPTPTNDPVQRTLQLINQHRAQYNLPALTLNTTQSVNSAGHAQAMAQTGQIWHVNSQYPQYSFPQSIVVPSSASAENVAMAGSADQADSLMWSEAHSAGCQGNHACNMIGAQYRSVGIGVYVSGGQAWVVEDFTSQASQSHGISTSSLITGGADGGRPIRPVAGATKPKNAPTHAPKAGAAGWYINTYYTADTHENIAPIINSVATKNGIWPVYALAVVMAESGGYTGVSSERFAVWPDWSCGLMQQIIANVTSFTGITNTRAACNWEEDPSHSIAYGTLLLHQYMEQTGVTYPALWECYNAGPGSCQSPYYSAFLTHYYIALQYATSNPGPSPQPPPPPPVPHKVKFGKLQARVWSQYRHERHLSFIPHHGWFAQHWKHGDFRHAGGIVRQEQWNSKRRVMTEFLQGGFSFWHPGHPQWTTWKGRSHWLK